VNAVRELVEIWTVALDPPETELSRLYGFLSPVERERAGRPPLDARKRRYVARQGAVRKVLGRCLGVPAAEVRLARAPGGKPIVSGNPGLRFSVSDSADLALVAVARCELGIDVEQLRDRPIASRSALGLEEFFERWTKLEAVAKAGGGGLPRARPGDGGFTCLAVQVRPGFAAAVAVEADQVGIRVRPYAQA
jgi:4'-phosphopantetheinyl transferase